MTKDVEFEGDSLERLRDFPEAPRRAVGFQLDKVQQGLDPDDWKAMPDLGKGVREIRVRDDGNQYRTVYVASLGDAIYVLHVFRKKTQKTALKDTNLVKQRYSELAERLAKQAADAKKAR